MQKELGGGAGVLLKEGVAGVPVFDACPDRDVAGGSALPMPDTDVRVMDDTKSCGAGAVAKICFFQKKEIGFIEPAELLPKISPHDHISPDHGIDVRRFAKGMFFAGKRLREKKAEKRFVEELGSEGGLRGNRVLPGAIFVEELGSENADVGMGVKPLDGFVQSGRRNTGV